MVKKYPACRGEFNTASTPYQEWRTKFVLKIANLAAQRGLTCVQLFLRRKLKASCFGDSHEVTNMP